VLVVDDDEGVLRFASRTLRQAGYRVLEAADGARALELAAAEPAVALVVSDLGMPVLGGQALVERLARDHPTVRVVYMSGRAELGHAPPSSHGSQPAMLEKPFLPDALLEAVREELDREPAHREALDRAGSQP
jgi:DNA-binding NtrC family response regulator